MSATRLRPSIVTLGILVASLAVLLFTSWKGWGHVMTDCGGSVDLAARLASGQVLYRDVQSIYGPLSTYVVAGFMRAFGLHLDVVYGVGIGVLLCTSTCWWAIVRRFLSEVETAAGLLAFWGLLAVQPGMFNYVLPNTFANTFGAMFVLAALAAVVANVHRPRASMVVLASVLSAAAGLSKIEFGATAVGTVLIAVLISGSGGRSPMRSLALALLPGAIVVLGVAVVFLQYVSLTSLVSDNLLRLRTLQHTVGTYKAAASSVAALTRASELRWALLVLPLQTLLVSIGLATWRRGGGRRVLAGVLIMLATLPFLSAFGGEPEWSLLMRPPLWLMSWTGVGWLLVAAALVTWGRPLVAPRTTTILLVAATGVLSSARWGLQPMWPPFFAPLAPALMILIARYPASRLVPTTVAPAVAAVFTIYACLTAEVSWRPLRGELPAIETARGTLRARDAAPMRAVVEYVEQHTEPEAYVAVLPEERFINFFSERPHPARDPGTGPGWLATPEDKQEFVRQLIEHAPALIVVSSRGYGEFGAGRFEQYEPEIMTWIRQRYRVVARYGAFRIFAPLVPKARADMGDSLGSHPRVLPIRPDLGSARPPD